MYLFPGPRPKKKGLSSNGFTKTVTVCLRSIVPKRHNSTWPTSLKEVSCAGQNSHPVTL